MDKGGHGMVTMIKHTTPSEETEQIHLGYGSTTNHYYHTLYTEWMDKLI